MFPWKQWNRYILKNKTEFQKLKKITHTYPMSTAKYVLGNKKKQCMHSFLRLPVH